MCHCMRIHIYMGNDQPCAYLKTIAEMWVTTLLEVGAILVKFVPFMVYFRLIHATTTNSYYHCYHIQVPMSAGAHVG